VSAAIISPRARREVLDAVEWIARDNPASAQALLDAVEKAAERIGARPAIGRTRPALAQGEYRFLTIAGFPYIIVYSTSRSRPVIVRMVHSARDLPRLLRDLR
jgi:toxin ParE1/3/4